MTGVPTLVPAERQARLRGALGAEQLGARGLERMARNPSCRLLKALTVAGLSPATVAERVYGESPREQQSPFAIGAGNQFETGVFENGAARLLDLYRSNGTLSLTECRIVDVPELAPGVTPAAMARRQAISLRLLRAKLAREPWAPNLIIKPRLQVTLLGLVFNIEPDALLAADTDTFYRPLEIKSASGFRASSPASSSRPRIAFRDSSGRSCSCITRSRAEQTPTPSTWTRVACASRSRDIVWRAWSSAARVCARHCCGSRRAASVSSEATRTANTKAGAPRCAWPKRSKTPAVSCGWPRDAACQLSAFGANAALCASGSNTRGRNSTRRCQAAASHINHR
jgi:hypothetical protein